MKWIVFVAPLLILHTSSAFAKSYEVSDSRAAQIKAILLAAGTQSPVATSIICRRIDLPRSQSCTLKDENGRDLRLTEGPAVELFDVLMTTGLPRGHFSTGVEVGASSVVCWNSVATQMKDRCVFTE